MDSGLYAAVNGALRSEMRLGLLANNLSNVNTNGFKQDNITFDSYMNKPGPELFPLAQDSFMGGTGPGNLPYPFSNPATQAYRMTYPRTDSTTSDLTQGTVRNTGNPLDVAIEGEGFFGVQTANGQRRYTRDGAFQVNNTGELVTRDGLQVLSEDGGPLVVGNEQITISKDGIVSGANGAVGRLMRVTLPKEGLQKIGQNQFTAPTGSETPVDVNQGGVHQGFLEGSNADTIRGMTQMIETNRAFEVYMKMIRALDDLDGQAATQVGRVQG